MASLQNRVVVITGAGSGIGAAAAVEFAKKGCAVVLVGRRADRLHNIEEQISAFNGNCLSVPTDVADAAQVEKLFERVVERLGRVDILVNNAGRGLRAELCDTDYESWQAVIQTNLTAVFLCTKAAAKIMKRQQTGGAVITVCSVAGYFGAARYSAYCASKHAVAGFIKSIRWELRKYRIRVWGVFPGRVDTEFFENYGYQPSKRQMLQAGDIADCIVAMAKADRGELWLFRVRNFLKRIGNLVSAG